MDQVERRKNDRRQRMASQEWLAVFFVVLWRKNEHKETRIGYKIRILGQNVQPGIQNLFGN